MRLLALVLLWFSWQVAGGAIPGTEREEGHTRRIVPRSHVLHERHTSGHVHAWTKRSRVEASTVLPVRVGLKQSNLEYGHEKLVDISDPESPNYGKHLSSEEVVDLFAPHENSVSAVKEWLVSAGVSADRISRSLNKQWIQFDAPVAEVEHLLYTDYHVYEHDMTGSMNVACSGYHVPESIRHHIDYITPGIRLMSEEGIQQPAIKKRKTPSSQKRKVEPDSMIKTLSVAAQGERHRPADEYWIVPPEDDCLIDTTPDCIRAQYGVPKGTKKNPKNKLGVFQGLNIRYWQGDLDRYFAVAEPDIPAGTRPVDHLANGAVGETDKMGESGMEAVMDFQLAMSLVWPQETVLWHVDDPWHEDQHRKDPLVYKGYFNNLFNAMDGSYCNYTAYNYTGNCQDPSCLDPMYPNEAPGGYKGDLMCGVFEPTNVLSISYSGSESSLPPAYLKRQCDEIMKLSLQGVTVVVSSGDNGVGGHRRDPPPIGCLGADDHVFNPSFPSNCPYVLSVGGTSWTKKRMVEAPEPKADPEEEKKGKGKGKGTGEEPKEPQEPGESGRPERPARPEEPEDPGRNERPERPERPENPENPGEEQKDPDPKPKPEPEEGEAGDDPETEPRPEPKPKPAPVEEPTKGKGKGKGKGKDKGDDDTPNPPPDPPKNSNKCKTKRKTKRQAPDASRPIQPPYIERAPVSFESGGGFSNVYDAPDYQKNHTAAYFETLRDAKINLGFEGYQGGRVDYDAIGDDGKRFNIIGRGYPDLAAVGDNIYTVHQGDAVGVMGTSASTPIVAAMINLVNEERLAVGKGPVGWIHPVIYSHPEIFRDVTVGANPNCRSDGFRASKGWDPVTGLGSPDFPKMLELFMSLP